MSKGWKIAAAVWMAVFFIAGQAHAAPERIPAWRHQTCRYNGSNVNRNWSTWEVRKTIDCALDHWPTNRGLAWHIAERESGLYHHAVNPSSGACGLFQFYPASSYMSHWRHFGYLNGVAPAPNCFNARSNALSAIRFMHHLGFGPWGY